MTAHLPDSHRDSKAGVRLIRRILVVCVGNICRSPIGEGLLRARLPGVEICSAGTAALVGEPAHPLSIAAAAELGIDISAHRATQLTAALIRRADLVLTMDAAQKREIIDGYPFATGRVYRIGEQDRVDVPDPYRQPVDRFRHARSLIERGVNAWIPKIDALR